MRIIISLILFLIVFASCNDNITNPYINGDIIPLAEGNQWIYEVTKYDSTGKNVVSTRLDTMLIGVKDSSGLYHVKGIFGSSPLVYLSNSKNGLKYSTLTVIPQIDSNGKPIDKFGLIEKLLFKYPQISKGLVYNVDELNAIKVENVNTRVKTSIGNFRCCVYKYYTIKGGLNFSTKIYTYLSPGVGIIKYEIFDESNIKKILKESYILKHTNVI